MVTLRDCIHLSQPSPVSPLFQYLGIKHMCLHFLFLLKEKKNSPPQVSQLGTHAACIGCVVSPIQDSCTGWQSLRSPLCLHACPPHPCLHTHSMAISHPFYTTSLRWNTCTCTHVIAALGLLSPPWWAWATIHSVSIHSFSSVPRLEIPTHTRSPPASRSYVTTAVCQLSFCPTQARDEAETQRVYREGGLASLSLPAVTASWDFHLSHGFASSYAFHNWESSSEHDSYMCLRGRALKCDI